jgi:sialate O-acetylesterase
MEAVKTTNLSLAKIFSDNMVLQRDKEIKIWGHSNDNHAVTVVLGDNQVTVNPVNGVWESVLPPMQATESCELRVISYETDEQILVRNIAIGEVWIAGGQSNMEFDLKFDAEAADSIATANNPLIRFFDSPKVSYEGHELDDDFSEYGFWRICNSTNAPHFSAVGYYFAQQIFNSLKVPIGIVECNWGGTTASAWLDESYLAADEDLKVYLEKYQEAIKGLDLEEYEKIVEQNRIFLNSDKMKNLSDNLMAGVYTKEQLEAMLTPEVMKAVTPIIGPKYFNRPAGLYHTMIEKIAGYSARGVIWYQGESDCFKANIYDKLFTALIKSWREAWQDKLPFLFVQLAPFESWLFANGEEFPILREKQEHVSKTVSDTYMASIMDVGMRYDIHPKNKRTVGERLALLARGKVYGQKIICEAPEVNRATRDNDRIIIEFTNVGDGFILKGKLINGLHVFVEGNEITVFETELDKNRIFIESKELIGSKSVEVQFACTDYVQVNLYSSIGLAAKPFRLII